MACLKAKAMVKREAIRTENLRRYFQFLLVLFSFFLICLNHDFFYIPLVLLSSFQFFLFLLLVLRNGNSGV